MYDCESLTIKIAQVSTNDLAKNLPYHFDDVRLMTENKRVLEEEMTEIRKPFERLIKKGLIDEIFWTIGRGIDDKFYDEMLDEIEGWNEKVDLDGVTPPHIEEKLTSLAKRYFTKDKPTNSRDIMPYWYDPEHYKPRLLGNLVLMVSQTKISKELFEQVANDLYIYYDLRSMQKFAEEMSGHNWKGMKFPSKWLGISEKDNI
jgi:hypothetical protein